MNNFPPPPPPPPPSNPVGVPQQQQQIPNQQNQPNPNQQIPNQPQQLTHYNRLVDKKYLGSWDHPSPDGPDLILTIARVVSEEVIGEKNKKEICAVIYWMEPGWKPMIANSTNRKNLHKFFGTQYVEYWQGRKVALYVDHNVRDPKVKGGKIDGLRFRDNPTRL